MFEAYNDSGNLQFNALSYNYYLTRKGTVTIADTYDDPEDPGTYTETFGRAFFSEPYDLVFYKCSTGFFWPKNIGGTLSGSNTIDLIAPRIGFTSDPADSIDVEYFCFRSMRNLTPSSSGTGIEIYDAAGNVCYTTAQGAPLRVISKSDIVTFNSGFSGSVTMASGNYAWASFGTVQNANLVPAIKTRTTGWDGQAFNVPWLPSRTVTAGGIMGVDVSTY